MFYKNPHFQKTIFLILCLVLCNTVSKAQHAPFEVALWPSTPPGNSGLTGPETIDEHGFVHNVTLPSLLVYPAAQEKNTGMAVLIAPGGGYSFLAINHEGKDIAQWLAENGITGVVLKYRIPNGSHAIPLADAKQGMRLIRENAAKWEIDPNSVGVMGSSAGGHLASTLLTHFDAATRPDFGVLFYPVITFADSLTHRGSVRGLAGENPTSQLRDYYSNEKQVTAQTPPVLLLQSDDDRTVPPQNSAMFYEALKSWQIPAALYTFPSGGHGWGFRSSFRFHSQMKQLLLDWLQNDATQTL